MLNKKILILLLLFIASLHSKAKNQDSLKNNKLSFGLYLDELLSRQIDIKDNNSNYLDIRSKMNDIKGGREFYETKWYHLTPLIVYKKNCILHHFGFNFSLYSPKTLRYQAGEYNSNDRLSSIGGFYRIQKLLIKKSKVNKESMLYPSFGFRIDAINSNVSHGSQVSSGFYNSSQFESISTKKLILGFCPSIHLKEEKADIEFGININLISLVSQKTQLNESSRSGDPPWTPLVIKDNKNMAHFVEVLTPYDFFKAKTMFFSINLIYNYNIFRK